MPLNISYAGYIRLSIVNILLTEAAIKTAILNYINTLYNTDDIPASRYNMSQLRSLYITPVGGNYTVLFDRMDISIVNDEDSVPIGISVLI